MSEGKSVYSNAQAFEQLGKAFESKGNENVTIPLRQCPDVPNFIRQLQLAQDATRKHSIKFG